MIVLNFALKTTGILKMFLLSAQNNFYVILSSYVEGYVKKNSSLSFMSFLVSEPPKSGSFFGKFTLKLVSKSFSGKNNSLEAPAFRFLNSVPYGLEESRRL